MAKAIWDWATIEKDYLAGKYKNLREIADKNGITYRMVQKRSSVYKWARKKKKLAQKTEDKIIEGMARDAATEALKAKKQILNISNILINQGLQKFYDEEGNLRKNVITNAQTALTALSLGCKMKMDLYGLRNTEEGEGNQNVFQVFQQQNNSSTINFQGISDDELERIISYGRSRLGIGNSRSVGSAAKKKGSKK